MPHESTRRIVRSSNKNVSSDGNHESYVTRVTSRLKEESSKTQTKEILHAKKPPLVDEQTKIGQNKQEKTSFLQREPYNDELELEETALDQGNEWKTSVIDGFVQLLSSISTKNALSDEDSNPKGQLVKGLIACATIKKLNRISHLRVNKARNKTFEDKSKLDEHHLELQNLLYEISHIKKEINKCLEFRSLDEDISLVSVEEFYLNAPNEVSNPLVTRSNDHKLKLARLDWELLERQRMLEHIKHLETSIDSYQNEVKLKREQLDSLQPRLNQIIEASKPTLQYLQMNFDDECNVTNESVQYLPKTLYTFYMMINAYKDAIDKNLKIEVVGDLDEAKRFDKNERLNIDDDDSESGGEDDLDSQEYKKKSKSKKAKRTAENPIDKIFKSYPLSIRLTISLKSYGQIILNFSYMSILKIIAVKPEITLEKEVDLVDCSLLQAENIFVCLYNNDYGTESPNVANKFILTSLDIESFASHIKHIGWPYKWAQLLCGLNYSNVEKELKDVNFKKLDTSQSDNLDIKMKENDEKLIDDESDIFILADKVKNETIMFQKIINKLKSRFKARYILQDILISLKKGILPNNGQQNESHNQINSKLISFKESNWEQFSSKTYTEHLRSANVLNEFDNLFYDVILSNGDAKLHSQIVINQNYPLVQPLFAIEINWKSVRNYANDEAIRDLERELNICHENFGDLTLSHKNYSLFAKQMIHLHVCLDIYLESESYALKTNEFPRTKFFLHAVRGRDRRRPYSYISTRNLYTQRQQYIR